GRHIDAEVLERPDFSTLTDLSQCAERVRAMAIVPFTTRSIIPLAIAGLMPMLPVVATVIPLSTYDWEHSQWTVPLNVSVSQLLKVGRQPI
ncbi:MAG: hypothetical protein ACREV1_13370, partial [Gammaproteobacteria bacterium]